MQASRLVESAISPPVKEMVSKPDSLNKDDFLKLLLAQIQHQDPLNPLNNTDFLAQLSQFSQLEQIYNLNQSFQTLAATQNSIRDSLLANLLGKTARVEASEIYLDHQNSINLSYELIDWADKVTINIYDPDGHLVRTIETSNQDSGMQKIVWDGTDNKGVRLPVGKYTVEITAYSQGESSWLTPYLIDQVKEVIFSQGGDPLLLVADQAVPISSLVQISGQ
ncbi:MAG: flagellar hook capping protein [bacterium]|nr:flagellar hook capping protein [bacterium]